MIVLKKILVFLICFGLFSQPLLAGNVTSRYRLTQEEYPTQFHSLTTRLLDASDELESVTSQNPQLPFETNLDFLDDHDTSHESLLPFGEARLSSGLEKERVEDLLKRLENTETSWKHIVRWSYASTLLNRVLYPLSLKESSIRDEGHPYPEYRLCLMLPDSILNPHELYIEVIEDESLKYTVIDPSGKRQGGLIDPKMLAGYQFSNPINIDLLSSFLPDILKITSKKGHTFNPSKKVWVYGGSLPLQEERSLKRVYGLNAFLEGCETVLMEGVDLTFKALLISQVFYSITEGQSFSNMFELIFTGDDNSIRNIYHVTDRVNNAGALWALGALPPLWGLYRGGRAYHSGNKKEAHHEIAHGRHALKHTSPSSYHDFWRWFLPFSSLEEGMESLSKILLWDGRISETEKDTLFQELREFSQTHTARSRNQALYIFSLLASGSSIKNLDGFSEEIRTSILNRKAQALAFLEIETNNLLQKLKSKQVFKEGFPSVYSRYLLWTLGQIEGLKENLFWTAVRLSKSVITILLLKTIIQGIIDILNCPQQPGFTWTGPAPWASDYTYDCFQAYMNAFNNPVPGQPVETLTSLFSQFHLPSVIDMDLSGKGLNGTIISEILKAFVQYQPNVSILVNPVGDSHSIRSSILIQSGHRFLFNPVDNISI